MKRGVVPKVFAGLVLLVAGPAMAGSPGATDDPHNYPTLDRYQFITECMAQQGEVNHQTLYACACTIDVIAEELPHDRYQMADTAQRMAGAAGESAEVYREPPRELQEVRRELAEAKEAANNRCFVPPNRLKNIWPDF